MTLIDTERAESLYAAMGQGIEVSGGSAANTIAGIAAFGGRAAYIGRVGDDELGAVFARDLRATGASYTCPPAPDGPPTGRCLVIVSPDAERTMNTYLGSSELFGPDDLDEDLIAAGKVVYLEGYLFDRPAAQEAFWMASRIAHDAGRQVSLTLSDTFCVQRHQDAWRSLLADQIDLLFANEGEVMALYGVTTVGEAIERVMNDVEIAAITRGEHGSLVVNKGEVIEVAAHPVDVVVDTTAAGDLYAAGFLFGFTSGRSLEGCGRLGSLGASAVIGHTGARPALSLAGLAADLGL
ncbi:MAG: adenosine kinase [Acidimicrobiia bacterium]|nr:adenosine kinase [Acidimicrobiia bacterium]